MPSGAICHGAEILFAVSRTSILSVLTELVSVRVYFIISAPTRLSGVPTDQRFGVVVDGSTVLAQAHVSPSEIPGASVQVTTAVIFPFCHLSGLVMREAAERVSEA